MDKIEWRHLKAIDRTGSLLQTVLSAVHTWGIPSSWRRSKTVLIHPSNFRPISLLSSLYKLYSGVLAQTLTQSATTHGWLSAEQKGFLPGVRGIQEHTFLLQTAIDEAKKKQGDLTNTCGPSCDQSATRRWIIPHHLQSRQRAPRSIGKGRPGNRGLDLDKKSKDVTHLLSSRSSLSFTAWSYWAKLRVNGLAVRGAPGSTAPDKLCRFCRSKQETTSHVVSACPVHLPEMTGTYSRWTKIVAAPVSSDLQLRQTIISPRRLACAHVLLRHPTKTEEEPTPPPAKKGAALHHRPEDASKMQRLYGRYPRKALREVLGEDSLFYLGGRDRLDFVAATYHNHNVTPAEVAEARRLYNNCNWEQPSQEEMELLQSPPSADEILRRLKKTVNTSPRISYICRASLST
ncbi:hypothetical protein EGW08_017535 [Elysia chlorotica]|uniref:Reverse transcriptase domain-containing protein n=1 Tax=Elysia chlorotica TaxID=188477 RepID=A0A433SZG9_ELYCH|nr:hypothetical protein EGW08_017535 [Elysia chlorotica]